jgi:hypothetical protein
MSNSSVVNYFPVDGMCKKCFREIASTGTVRRSQRGSCGSCKMAITRFANECERLPHIPTRADLKTWLEEQTNGDYEVGFAQTDMNYYVYFVDPKDRVLYKMFWSDQI